MGLIKLVAGAIGAASGAFNTTTQNAWVDYFESGDMSNGIIMKRGNKIVGKNSMNKGGDDNIITSGSGIDVQENQCMILVENGAIVDFCAEPGRYRFDSSTAPSLMSGNNKGLKALAASFGSQFLAGGQRTSTQRVYYINLGEIQGFKWGSGNINFDHWETDWNTGKPCWHIATTLMGNGVYSIQVTDPAKFYSVLGAAKAGADGDGLVTRQDIEPQIKTEAIAAIRQGVGRLSGRRIGYQEIAAHEFDLTQEVDRILDQSWEERGISIFKIAIGMMDADDKSKEQITRYQETKGYATDPSMLGAYMGIGNTQAMQAAAANTNGAVNAFAAMGMGGSVGMGTQINQLMQSGAQQQAMTAQAQQIKEAQAGGWTCTCGQYNTGNFCQNCGTKRPEAAPAAFCPNCGNKFEDPANLPKFCPNCGTKL